MVNGQRVGFVWNGKSADFELPPGKHEIWVSLDWCRSPARSIEVPADGMVELRAQFRGGFLGSLLYSFIQPKSTYDLDVLTPQGANQYFRPGA